MDTLGPLASFLFLVLGLVSAWGVVKGLSR